MGKERWIIPEAAPKRGWTILGIEDREKADEVCQACDYESVRYVHHLSHPNWPALEVGCVCAGELSGAMDVAKWLLVQAQNRTARRKKWVARRKWKTSEKGNDHILLEARYRLLVFPQPAGLSRASLVRDDVWTNVPGLFRSREEAKLAAFDFLWPATILPPDGHVVALEAAKVVVAPKARPPHPLLAG